MQPRREMVARKDQPADHDHLRGCEPKFVSRLTVGWSARLQQHGEAWPRLGFIQVWENAMQPLLQPDETAYSTSQDGLGAGDQDLPYNFGRSPAVRSTVSI